MSKVKIGIIGCGNISDIYIENIKNMFDNLELVACADINTKKAEEQADKYSIKTMSVDDMLTNEDIEIILNITTPQAHKIVAKQALMAGKHVYNEKPLVLTRDDGKELLDLAREKNLMIGCAPDTFLGAGIQTCRKIIEDGMIGDVIAATAFMTNHGHESWHPSPEFYYKAGGGPMFDMGPYYLTALINLVGPIRSVNAYARKTFEKREITSEPLKGTNIIVDVPTHIAGNIEFENGAIGTIITSFDTWGSNLPCIEIHGTKGSISVPDPNTFGGEVKIKRAMDDDFAEVKLTHSYEENSRGIGLSDMANAIIHGSEFRANGELAYHVLDVMQAFHDASDSERNVLIESTCKQPDSLPAK